MKSPASVGLRSNLLKSKLKSQKFVVGTFLGIPAPALVELLGLAGFDFFVIDSEHGAIDFKEMEELIRASLSTEICPMVRVPSDEPFMLFKPLDMGAAGIHVPQVVSPEGARRVVLSSKYFPLGNRGLQPYVRSASYGTYGSDQYLPKANEDTLIVVQLEEDTGVSNLEGILNVEGVDVVFIGPYDLSQALGVPGQVRHPHVRDTIIRSIRTAQKTGKWIGIYCDDVETALEYKELGVSYLVVSIDLRIFLSKASAMLSELKT